MKRSSERTPGVPVPLQAFGFECVQGLWGGSALWVSEDRSAILQRVQPGLWEKRYQICITEEQWAETERLVGARHFLQWVSPVRNGLPDEAHPTILLITRSGVALCAAKWANDSLPDFDALYEHLGSLCQTAEVPVREGLYERLTLVGIKPPAY